MTPSSRPTPWSILFGVIGFLAVAMGLMVACLALSLYFDPAPGDAPYAVSWLMCFVFLALPILLSGLASLFYARRRRRQEAEQRLQALLLEMARRQGGSVSASELALASPLSFHEAQSFLESLAARGICRMEMGEEGDTRFVLLRPTPEIAPRPEWEIPPDNDLTTHE